MQLDENENPEILNREMKQVLLTNVKKQQSIEFNFLEISILSVTLNTKILGENKEILCKVSFEKIDHEIQSCITSNQGKYFFPKHSMKYIMQNTSLNQNLLFSFSSSSKNDIGVCCFVIDQSVASSKRQNLPIYGSNNQIVGEVTFLPQFQDEGYFDDSESDCMSSVASKTPPSSVRRLPPFSGHSTSHRSVNKQSNWSNKTHFSPSLISPECSPLPQGGIRVGDPSISLLSHFDLEDKESVEKTVSSPRSLTPKNCSDCVDNPPSSEDISLSSTDPSSLKSGDQNISDEVTCNDTSNVSNRIDLLKSDIANNSELSAQSFHTFSTVSEKASSFLTPTSIMIGLLAIFFIVKSNSRII